MKIIKVKPIMSVEESDTWKGKLLTDQDCKTVLTEDCDVYDKESGTCLAKYRKRVIPLDICVQAYEAFKGLPSFNDVNRGTAGGHKMEYRVLADGKRSNTLISKKAEMGIAGYFDRTVRFPNCRLTAFNRHHFDKFKAGYPLIKFVDNKYKELMPKEYKLQRTIADKTSQDFVIRDTAFTTVTVNKNYQTGVHKDAGDFKNGFGNLTAIRDGTYTGAILTLVRWGVGFDIRNQDLLLMDVHQWHGNTSIVKDDPKAVRLSFVMYYRENMIHCGSLKEELQRAQNRKQGDKINPSKNEKKNRKK